MKLLCIETSTKSCSVALSSGAEILAQLNSLEDSYTHAENLHQFIQSCLEKASLSPKDLDAIVVSKGPGSYTGLRIGVSAAKGLAYALDIPIVSLDSLEITASTCQANHPDYGYYIPMLDARRMEVYLAVYNHFLQRMGPIEAVVIDADFQRELPDQRIAFCGDGAEKCRSLLEKKGWEFVPNIIPDAAQMVAPALEKLKNEEVENTAYFEPFYLKEFIAGKPKKML